jgi:hypothetical protein
MPQSRPLPFNDFSARFHKDLRQRPLYYILSGPTLAKSSPAIGKYLDLNPMIGTQNEVAGVMDMLRPLKIGLDIWLNITAPQDIYDWNIFMKFLSTPETALMLTPFSWMSHSHLMELEREYIIQHFHKIISFDSEVMSVFSKIQVNKSVNSLTYFLFFAHLLEIKGPIFLFGCDGVSSTGEVKGYDCNNHFGITDLKHIYYDHIDEDRERNFLIGDTQGLNENWPVVESWFERRNIRRIPIYNVSGAGYVTPFKFIEPEDIPEKVKLCDAQFDPEQRTLSSGEYWNCASLQGNISRYDHFCSQFPSTQIHTKVIPFISDATTLMKQTKDNFDKTLGLVVKSLSRLQ